MNISLTKNGGHFFGYVNKLLYPIFQKIYPSQKWGSLSIFKFVTKSAKHQIPSVSLTTQDRAISSKFLKHTVSKITTLPKNHFSYILALLSYKQDFLTWLSCHYFSFSGRKNNRFVLQAILYLLLWWKSYQDDTNRFISCLKLVNKSNLLLLNNLITFITKDMCWFN